MDSKKYKVNKVNAYNGWDPLKQVVLGNVFEPEFFEDIKDSKLRDLLQQILYETREDLDGIQKTLEDLGVEVVRIPSNGKTALGMTRQSSPRTINEAAEIGSLESQSVMQEGKVWGLPKPCLMPRDDFITLGDRILYTSHLWDEVIDQSSIFNPNCLDTLFQNEFDQYKQGKIKYGPLKPTDHLLKDETDYDGRYFDATFQFWAPLIHRVGNRLIIDLQDWSNIDKLLLERYPEFIGANVAMGGHNDGMMNLPKPGLVVCSPDLPKGYFDKTLPGWDVLRIEHPNYMKGDLGDWSKDKHITNGKWWTPEAKSNPELVNYVEDWLTNWVGYSEESIFEVNMLAINPECSLTINYQPEVHKALNKHGIEPIYCRFRHRNFWDGGLHCLTLDTVREGEIQDYFK